MSKYISYIAEKTKIIQDCIAELGCQPIVFAGAGLTLRYGNGMSWQGLLSTVCSDNPLIEYDFAYYKQSCSDLLEVGEQFIPYFHKWAWSTGKENFPEALFTPNTEKDEFLKNYVAQIISKTTTKELSSIETTELQAEISSLQKIHPHSIITTNYDQFCELIFPNYTPVIGQKIIKASSVMIGEIFKIHGCISDHKEIVLTSSDYAKWTDRKKYLSAKLLTFFLEHPLLIVGYSAQDPNVLAILRDIDEILASEDAVVSNIFYVIYDDKLNEDSDPPKEIILNLGGGHSMRVHALYAKDFSWIYQAFSASNGMENINPKVLRALMARTYDLVRFDIPKMKAQCDYEMLEKVVSDNETLPKLLGITGITDLSMFNAAYPYTLTGVAEKLGFDKWHYAHKIYLKILEETKVDIKASDNQYHSKIKAGTNSFINKYSDAFVELLSRVQAGEKYDVVLKVTNTGG